MGGHVDYRGDGGYVVGPPSVHPSGRHYVWADGRSFKSPLPRLPESLRSLIVKPATRPQAERIVIANGSDILRQNTAARYAATRPDILATVELLGGIVRHHGAHYATNCFFHDDPGPSMVLYTHDNSFHCYGCEAHGDSDNLRMGKDMTGRRFI
jgi:hypothetical protein